MENKLLLITMVDITDRIRDFEPIPNSCMVKILIPTELQAPCCSFDGARVKCYHFVFLIFCLVRHNFFYIGIY